jgi:hypothetical protein
MDSISPNICNGMIHERYIGKDFEESGYGLIEVLS